MMLHFILERALTYYLERKEAPEKKHYLLEAQEEVRESLTKEGGTPQEVTEGKSHLRRLKNYMDKDKEVERRKEING